MNRAYRYHNLPPGKYRFHIKVKNSLGTWSDVVLSPVIQIKYPVYLQWWFILLILLTLTYLGYIIFKYIIYRRYNIRLAETVSQRTQELQESERQLMQSNRAKDRFLSIIGHDLRSPFNVILGYLDLLTDKSFVFTPAEREDILDKLKQTAHKTLSLLDNLLSWARTQKGEQKAQITSIDLCEIIGENVILAESMATAKKIKLVNHCRQSFHALGDKNMIHTVVRNLISNAIKFSYQGGTIEIGITSDKDHLITVSIKDHGCGISPENQARLFNSEDHFATKGTNKESGTGLGLLLCMEFIRLNNGKLWMESEQGKGSTFYFSLRSDDY
jgi:signal transduction histidine kinase